MGLIGHSLPLIAWLLLGACGVLCAWALFGDRARGRKRCRRCRYRMEGVPAKDDGTFVCPECGRKHANAKSLVHAHRRWRLALACVLVGAVGWFGLSFHWRFRERGPMGYVPTTLLVLLPQSAEAWYASVGGPVPRTPIAQEIIYRTDTIGMHVWQETMWVWNLRRHADEHAEGDWKWRWVRKLDLSGRAWERHRCSRGMCGGFINTNNRRQPCPGDGALQLVERNRRRNGLRAAAWLGGLASGMELTARQSRGDLLTNPLVFDRATWDWAPQSAYEAFFASASAEPIIRYGWSLLHRPAGWEAGVGRTSVADTLCSIEGHECFLRRFDLGITIRAVLSATEDVELYPDDDDLMDWVVAFSTIGDLDGSNGVDMPYPFQDRAYGTSLFIASTPEGLEDAQRRLEDFHEHAPALWRAQLEEDWSYEDLEEAPKP